MANLDVRLKKNFFVSTDFDSDLSDNIEFSVFLEPEVQASLFTKAVEGVYMDNINIVHSSMRRLTPDNLWALLTIANRYASKEIVKMIFSKIESIYRRNFIDENTPSPKIEDCAYLIVNDIAKNDRPELLDVYYKYLHADFDKLLFSPYSKKVFEVLISNPKVYKLIASNFDRYIVKFFEDTIGYINDAMIDIYGIKTEDEKEKIINLFSYKVQALDVVFSKNYDEYNYSTVQKNISKSFINNINYLKNFELLTGHGWVQGFLNAFVQTGLLNPLDLNNNIPSQDSLQSLLAQYEKSVLSKVVQP